MIRYFWSAMSPDEQRAFALSASYTSEQLIRAAQILQAWQEASGNACVYLCRNRRNGYTKIGFSTNPQHREKTLQSEEPDVQFIAVLPYSRDKERELHERYAHKRLRGEWFDLTDDDVDDIVFDTIFF